MRSKSSTVHAGRTGSSLVVDDGVPPAIGARYELGEPLGQGAFGRVYRARDMALDSPVAVKFVNVGAGAPELFLREIALLRLLRLPGVVGQIDDGVTGAGVPYLVTELIDGSHFPGCGKPAPWSAIEDRVVALLEATQRVHDAGVVHRDLKPANVLVNAAGVPTILDFGLARNAADRETERTLVGTPSYLAPEQARGLRAGPRADLYAIGVMIYEALTGSRPIEGRSGPDVIARKVDEPPIPLAVHRPDAPGWLLALVDRMVATAPADRPASAAEILAAMEHPLPTAPRARLGPPLVAEVATRVLAGERLTVGGASGSGRSRFVEDLAVELASRGAMTSVVRAGSAPPPPGHATVLFDAPTVHLDDGLAARAAVRTVDGDTATVVLRDMTPDDLCAMFHGPEHLLHLPSEAAVELHRRSGGNARNVMREVAAWVRAGLCHWEDGRLRITRAAIDALRTTYPVLDGGGDPRPRPDGSGGPPGALAPARERVRAGDTAGAAREALGVSRDAAVAGLDGEAFAVALEANRLARAASEPALQRETLRNVVGAALLTYSVRSVDIARWEVAASRVDADERHRLSELLRVWEEVVQGVRSDAELVRPSRLPFFGDEVLDRALCIAFARVTNWSGPLGFERGAAIARWLAGDRDGERSKHVAGCMARAAFLHLDFDLSAALHEYAATRRSPADALASLTSAAYAYLEAYRLDDAERVAERALTLARSTRMAADEFAALDTLARARYRRGEPNVLGAEFRGAVGHVAAVSAAVVAVHDAASAWRLGDTATARAVAREATRAFARARLDAFVDVTRAMSAMLGEPIAPARVRRIRNATADALPPGLGLQALGMLAIAGHGVPEDAPRAATLASRLPRRTWGSWREILSVDECLQAVNAVRDQARTGG